MSERCFGVANGDRNVVETPNHVRSPRKALSLAATVACTASI
jgi:hypothetical protein